MLSETQSLPLRLSVGARTHAKGASRTRMKASPISWFMLLAIAAIAVLAYLDEERESAAALSDFAQEQVTLAHSLAAGLTTHLGSVAERPNADVLPGLLADARRIERPNRVTLLMRPPGTDGFYTTDGRVVESPRLAAAIAGQQDRVRLLPSEAGAFKLPARTALAGLARVDGAAAGSWYVVAVASAERERDRERWARWRLILSVVAASGLVVGFGGVAMRNQRKELLLQHKLALTDLGRERDERLARANRAATVGTLAIGVAHEISTPLGIISGRAEQLLPRVVGDERALGSVRIILEQTDRIHRVIRGLLGLARGDHPAAEPVRPEDLVQGAVALVEHRFEQAGVRLRTEIAENLPELLGDPRLLEHAVVNLLLNACDACSTGGAVGLAAAGDGSLLSLSVVDDGPGIPREVAGRVLEPFFSTKASGKGTGIGLAIVQEIVASHRGSLTLAAVVPHGTRAVIQLPFPGAASHA